MVWTANRIIRTGHRQDGNIKRSDGPAKIREIFRIVFQTLKQLPIRTPKAAVRTRVLETPILTRIRASKAYK
jgi:hypothetical protein